MEGEDFERERALRSMAAQVAASDAADEIVAVSNLSRPAAKPRRGPDPKRSQVHGGEVD